ncbi:biosynthetic peptidoglycan transglycosylase [Shewanella sp. BJSY2023SW001]|uniref:biosynthetic peptidoglycan transglycosylase n=1 Tax=Shewanella sp. BJSY2023SW001 TaxID=3392039 RepID=UPI0039B66F26
MSSIQESIHNKMKLKDEWNQLTKSIEKLRIESADKDLSDNLLDLLVAGEDHRFWSHFGVDPIGLVRATWKTIFCNKREGGSTIAMQLVRTVTGRYEISSQRKLKEIYLATKITLTLERKEILKLYLNVAYFGWNMHGIDQACKRLELDMTSLTNYEAAGIVARLKYPEPRFGNSKSFRAVHQRASYIVNRFNQLNSKGQYGTI